MTRRRTAQVDWSEVFRIRCRSKRGETLSAAELDLCRRALASDPDRYGKLDEDVFNATIPFGSSARWKP